MPEYGAPEGSVFVASPGGCVRFRVWVDGVLVEEDWAASPEEMEPIAKRHQATGKAASDAGKLILCEVYDPELPEDRAYMRFGTDPAGCVKPVRVTAEDLAAEAERRWPYG